MTEVYSADGNRMDRRDKPPGMTLAEALGIDVPKNAPGGQRALPASAARSGGRTPHHQPEYDGFTDLDAWRRDG